MKIAIIIKHPYRANDWRVDIAEVDDDATFDEITEAVMKNMLGPFEIMGITKRIQFNRTLKINKSKEPL